MDGLGLLTIQYPVALFTFVMTLDLLAYLGKTGTLRWTPWFLAVGVLGCIPVLFDAWHTKEQLTSEFPYANTYFLAAFCLISYAFNYTLFRFVLLWKEHSIQPIVFLGLSLMLLLLTYWTLTSLHHLHEMITF